MAPRSRLDTLVRSYQDDLRAMQERALEALDEGPDNAVPMLRKLLMEVVRLDVYEEATLLPAVRQFLPDGDDRARALTAQATERERALEALSRQDLAGPAFREGLTQVLEQARSHDTERDALLRDLGEAMPEADLEEAGALFTPTQQAGSTHSVPTGLALSGEGQGWPAPGWVERCRQAFMGEVAARRAAGR
jgi:hypothetical protein